MDVGETGLGSRVLDSGLSWTSLGVILHTLPPLSEPHLFSSNVEQPGSRGPSSAVSYASGMEEGGSVDPFWGQGWKWVSDSPGAALCHLDSWGGGRAQWLWLIWQVRDTCSTPTSLVHKGVTVCVPIKSGPSYPSMP